MKILFQLRKFYSVLFILDEVLSRIFQKEDSSSTSSSLPYEKRARRRLHDGLSKEIDKTFHIFGGCQKEEKETNTCCDEAENKDKKTHFGASKKTENLSLSPFQNRVRGNLNEGKMAYLNQSSEAKIPPKKSSVEIQVSKDEEVNGELILFSPRKSCHHKRDVCGFQQRLTTDSSDFGKASLRASVFSDNKQSKDRANDTSQIQEYGEDADDDVKMMRALQIYSQDSIQMSCRNDVSLHDELMEATKTQMTTGKKKKKKKKISN